LFHLQQERDDLHNRFVTAIIELQQKIGLKNVLLEKKLTALNDLLEQKEAQMNEVLAAAHLDPTAMTTVNKKLEVQFTITDIMNGDKSWYTMFGHAEIFPHDL
jgi:hypothetical protein